MIRDRMRKRIMYILGILSTIIGIAGIVVPVLPTTVFFILASGLFIKSNEGLYRWLHKNRITGCYLRAYTLGEGLSRKSKMRSITLLWLTLAISSWFVRELIWLVPLLAVVGIAVSWHIITIKPHPVSPEKLAMHKRIMNKGMFSV